MTKTRQLNMRFSDEDFEALAELQQVLSAERADPYLSQAAVVREAIHRLRRELCQPKRGPGRPRKGEK